jgi:glycosyltransferase involved in cell wall biosynthesis
MRILAVGNMYPPPHLGGYEIVWQSAMRRARSAGHDVRVLTASRREGEEQVEEDPDVNRELELYWSWADHEWRRLRPLERLRFERRNAAAIERHLAEFEPDVVSFWAMGAMSLSLVERVRRAGIPTMLVVHDDWLVYGPRRDAWMRLWSGRRRPLAPLAEALTRIPTRFRRERRERVLANSEFILRRAREHGYRLPNAGVVSPGIEPDLLRPAPDRDWGWRLLCVGRLDRQKGTDTALDAIAELPDEATLVIAGSGDNGYEGELRERARRLGLSERVSFAGQVERARLAGLYEDADAVLFPVRWEEPFGLVPLEAMARGRPVLATPSGGAVEYLRDGANALLFGADDPHALAAGVRRLAEDAPLRDRLRAGGLETAAEHTSDAFDERIVEELERAASNDR